MERIIYNNFDHNFDQEEIRNEIADRQGCEPSEVTENDIWEEENELSSLYFHDEIDNLNKRLDGKIIAIANLGLWNGRRSGYKIGNDNLNEIMTMGNEDYIKIYSDGHNIRKVSAHHDGTNYILFRMIREDRDIEKFTDKIYNGESISNSVLNYYTKSINSEVKAIYGW